jgi:outer membrane protein
MKNTIKSIAAIAVFGALALSISAQPAPQIRIVDMAKLYDTHYKTLEQNAKIQADDQKAQDEVAKMNKEGQTIVDEYKALIEQSNNPTASAEAKSRAQNDAQKRYEDIQKKQQEVQTFIQNTRNSLGQRLNTFRSLMLEEISKIAADVAKRKGATILLDKAGPTGIGISNLVYGDPAYDITEDILKEINKDRPAGAPTAPPAEKGASAAGAAPAVSVPGLGTKK